MNPFMNGPEKYEKMKKVIGNEPCKYIVLNTCDETVKTLRKFFFNSMSFSTHLLLHP